MPAPSGRGASDLVWYAAYGSNLHLPRLTCYLAGGTPPGSRRTYLGARDPSPPRAVAPVWLPGSVRFAGDSPVWRGGVAVLHDAPAAPDDGASSAAATLSRPRAVAARAYLLTREQVCDVVAQETRREAGAVSELRAPLGGTGWYDALATDVLDGHPLVALAATDPPPPSAPGATYLTMLMHGLHATRGWSAEACADYVCAWPGAEAWTHEALVDLARALPTPG